MPGLTSKQILKGIKKYKIPVIFLTVMLLSEIKKKYDVMKNPLVVDYIQKPFEVDNFLKRVKKALK
jgi:DNA-binding response OmpR family regulator